MLPAIRPVLAVLIAALLLPTPASAFYTPLSDQAVREAYFLGQSHDGSYQRLLEKYTRVLPLPKTGPHISSVALLTPFILFAEYCSRQSNYSPPLAAIDYRQQGEEIVRIVVEIQLTESYGQFVAAAPANATSSGFILRSSDFWKDFQVRIYDGEEPISTSAFHGHANYICGRYGCTLIGATLEFEFPATAFMADTATIEVTPPEGDPVSVEFDHTTLR